MQNLSRRAAFGRPARAGILVLAACLAWPTLGHSALVVDKAVSIDNFTFVPAEITVVAGSRVVWTNHDDIPHTVTAEEDPKGTRSPALDTGDVYGRVFPKPGTYRYFCALHPHMRGTVVVR